jgi:hypothetical protein
MEKNPSADLLKLYSYGALAQFWANLGTGDEIAEDDAKSLLLLQKALIEEVDKTLQQYLDDASMKNFRDYVDRFRVRIMFGEEKQASRYHKR